MIVRDQQYFRILTLTVGMTLLCTAPIFSASLLENASGSIGDTLGNKPVPNWSGGALLTEEDFGTTHPSFLSYDRHGTMLGAATFTIPGATYLSLLDFSRGTDGTVAVCGSATDAQGRTAPFVAWVYPDGRNSDVIRTAEYHPRKITLASDGTIWTVGFESMPNEPTKANPNGFVFRRWNKSGELVGSYFPQSQLDDARSVYFGDFLRSSSRGVAWFSGREGRFIEISLAGVVASQAAGLRLPNPKAHITGMACTATGDTILSTVYGGKWSIMRLDLAGATWTTIDSGPSGAVLVYGADGNHIVARIGGKSGDFKFLALSK